VTPDVAKKHLMSPKLTTDHMHMDKEWMAWMSKVTFGELIWREGISYLSSKVNRVKIKNIVIDFPCIRKTRVALL